METALETAIYVISAIASVLGIYLIAKIYSKEGARSPAPPKS